MEVGIIGESYNVIVWIVGLEFIEERHHVITHITHLDMYHHLCVWASTTTGLCSLLNIKIKVIP